MHVEKKPNNTTTTAEGAHCWLRPSMSLLFIPLHKDNAKCLEEWPEMNERFSESQDETGPGPVSPLRDRKYYLILLKRSQFAK